MQSIFSLKIQHTLVELLPEINAAQLNDTIKNLSKRKPYAQHHSFNPHV